MKKNMMANLQRQLCDLANDTAGWAKHIDDTFPTKTNNDIEPPT